MDNFKKWLKAALVRAIKTICQTAIATIGTSAVLSDVNWKIVISASLLAGLLSILTSLAGLPEVEDKDKSKQLKLFIYQEVEGISRNVFKSLKSKAFLVLKF